MKKFFIGLGMLTVLVLTPIFPLSVASADPIVPKCNTGPIILKVDSKGLPLRDGSNKLTNEKGYANPCDFTYVIKLINNVITFLLFYFATPLAAIAFCYAGFLLITGGNNEHKRGQAKTIIKNVIIGYIIALAAWLIVKTIFSTLGFKGETFLTDK